MRRTAASSAALLSALAIVLVPVPTPVTASAATLAMTVGSTVTSAPAAQRPGAVQSWRFTPTPVLEGSPQWKPDTRVGFTLKNISADQARIVRSALTENGRATRVTFVQVTRGAKLTISKRKLYGTDADGKRFALPGSVVGMGGPSWDQSGEILSGTVLLSPATNSLPAMRFRSVVLHEIGHASGLDHSRHATSVMYPSLQPDSPSHYSTEDLASLKPRR